MSDQPKLLKLPPMPRKRGGRGGGLPRPKKAADLPVRVPEPDEVEEDTDALQQFGGTETGRWFATTSQDGSVGGRCAKCGRKRKAINLKREIVPFTNEENWVCKEGC